jgi:DNA repair protein RadA/Sms
LAKREIYFECEACGAKSPKWLGRCPSCSAWDSFVEVKEEKDAPFVSVQEKSQKLSEIEEKSFKRISTQISEFDRILGGGIVEGSTILLGGDPGVGKSTLLLQTLGNIGKNRIVLYSSAEESLAQIAERGRRISKESNYLEILSSTSLENIIGTAEDIKASVLVVDSIQTIFSERVPAAPGSLAQIRECSFSLAQFSKTKNIAVFVVGHITKEGIIAGPKALEHIVDVVLYLEGDNYKNFKVLRAQKNRFGTTNEIALFDMTEEGLKEVKNPSEVLLRDRMVGEAGSSIGISVEGTRAILFEIQSLFSPSAFGLAKRMSVGFDRNRMQLLTAVIERATRFMMGDKDIFINVVGGVAVDDPGLDLPLCFSIFSQIKNKAIPDDMASFGEVGLLGEVRATSYPLKRIKEAQALGFRRVVLPKSDFERIDYKEKTPELIKVSSLKDALKIFSY